MTTGVRLERAVVQTVRRIAKLRNLAHTVVVTDAETIGGRIKRERLGRDMTQRELAEAVGVGVPHISKVEAGRENPGDELLEKLAGLFDVDADELFLVARRVPDDLVEKLAADPTGAVAYLRQWNAQ